MSKIRRPLTHDQIAGRKMRLAEQAAYDALHFAYSRQRLETIAAKLARLGGLAYEMGDAERAALRAWLTGTDDRIGTASWAGVEDPHGYRYVATEVTDLDDNQLITRFEERRRRLADARFSIRHVTQLPGDRADHMAGAFEEAGWRAGADPKQQAAYQAAMKGLRARSGYVLWDRMNHAYVTAAWFPTYPQALKKAKTLNDRHRRALAARA